MTQSMLVIVFSFLVLSNAGAIGKSRSSAHCKRIPQNKIAFLIKLSTKALILLRILFWPWFKLIGRSEHKNATNDFGIELPITLTGVCELKF